MMSKAAHTTTTHNLEAASVEEHCRTLRLPTVGAQFAPLAHDALTTNQTHTNFLAALLGAEVEERERGTIECRIREAKFPRLKTLDEFDFAAAAHIASDPCASTRRRRIYAAGRASDLDRRFGNGQDTSFDGSRCGSLSTEEACPLYNGCWTGQ